MMRPRSKYAWVESTLTSPSQLRRVRLYVHDYVDRSGYLLIQCLFETRGYLVCGGNVQVRINKYMQVEEDLPPEPPHVHAVAESDLRPECQVVEARRVHGDQARPGQQQRQQRGQLAVRDDRDAAHHPAMEAGQEVGVDMVTIVGMENGGATGMEDVSTLVLLPILADAAIVPVIAGGGFADGRGLAAALALSDVTSQ